MADLTPRTPSVAFSSTTRTSCPLDVPAGTAEDDLMIALVAIQNATALPDQTGWNSQEIVGATALSWGLYWRWATASEPSSYSFDHNSARDAGIMLAIPGVDPTTPIIAESVEEHGTGNRAFNEVDPGAVEAVVFACLSMTEAAPDQPEVSGTNCDSIVGQEASEAGGGQNVGVAILQEYLASGGAFTPTYTITTGTLTRSGVIALAVKPAAGGGTVEGSGAAVAPAGGASGFGAVRLSGSGSAAPPAGAAGGAGAVGLTGSGAAAAAAGQASGAGTVEEPPTVDGSGAAVAPAGEAAGAGTVTVSGSGAAAAATGSAAGAGALELDGSGAASGPAGEAAGEGDLELGGSGAAAAAAGEAAGDGGVAIAGSGAAAGPVGQAAGSGGLELDGSGAPTAPAGEAEGSGTVLEPGASVGHVVAPPGEAAGAGTVGLEGAGAPAAPPGAAAGDGEVETSGTGATEGPPGAAAGTGGLEVDGSGSAVTAAGTASGAGTVTGSDGGMGPHSGPTPAERTLVIPAESRVVAVEVELRRLSLALPTPAVRRYTVAAERRSVTFT